MSSLSLLQQINEDGYKGPGRSGPGYDGWGYDGPGYEGPGYDGIPPRSIGHENQEISYEDDFYKQLVSLILQKEQIDNQDLVNFADQSQVEIDDVIDAILVLTKALIEKEGKSDER